MILRAYIASRCEDRAGALAALQVLVDGLGIRFVESALPTADLAYTAARPEGLGATGIWIRRQERFVATLESALSGFEQCLAALRTPSAGVCELHQDLLKLVGFVVTGQAERQLPANGSGVPLLANSSAALLRRPVVSEIVEALAQVLAQRHPTFAERVKRWPGGATAALMLTHDVDAPYRRPRAGFYRSRLARDAKGGNPVVLARALGGWAKARLQNGRSLPAAEDPNFGFDFWRRLEESLGGRGCFYVAVRSADEPGAHPDDVAYHAADPELKTALRLMQAAGWEIGLHASLRAAQDPGRFAVEKARLESLLDGAPVRGVRHHFWALNSEDPAETWNRQWKAGFAYDSSLGSNDAPGFRRGLAWPFLPGSQCPLQIPPTLMDGAAASDGGQGAETVIRRHLEQVFSIGGAANLNWHLEQSNPSRLGGVGPALVNALSTVRARSDIWIATPAEMAEWWAVRGRQRAALGMVRERISLRTPASALRHPRPSLRVSRAVPEANTAESSVRP